MYVCGCADVSWFSSHWSRNCDKLLLLLSGVTEFSHHGVVQTPCSSGRLLHSVVGSCLHRTSPGSSSRLLHSFVGSCLHRTSPGSSGRLLHSFIGSCLHRTSPGSSGRLLPGLLSIFSKSIADIRYRYRL